MGTKTCVVPRLDESKGMYGAVIATLDPQGLQIAATQASFASDGITQTVRKGHDTEIVVDLCKQFSAKIMYQLALL